MDSVDIEKYLVVPFQKGQFQLSVFLQLLFLVCKLFKSSLYIICLTWAIPYLKVFSIGIYKKRKSNPYLFVLTTFPDLEIIF